MPATATPPLVLVFPSRLGAVRLSADASAPATSWIQVAVVGDYDDPRYGKFSITRDMLATMLSNFTEGKFPEPPTEICVDYDHLTLKEAQRPGDGKAAGWFKQLELRDNGDELWARVEWTPAGADVVKTGEYRFFSPAFSTAFVTNEGKEIGCTLINGAITNRPFLQGMAPIELSGAGPGAKLVKVRTIVLTTLTDNDKRTRLESAIQQRFGDWSDGYCYDVWLCDTIDGEEAVFYKNRAYFVVQYAFAEDGSVAFTSDPEEVVNQWARLSAGNGGKSLMATITLTGADGKPVTINEKALEALPLVKELRAQLPTKDQKVVPAAEYAALTGTVTQLSAQVTELTATATKATDEAKKANDALALAGATTDVDALVAAGKVTPANRQHFIDLRLSNADMFTKITGALPVAVKLNESVGSGEDADPTKDPLAAAAAAIRLAQPTLSAEQATAKALEQNPSLYQS